MYRFSRSCKYFIITTLSLTSQICMGQYHLFSTLPEFTKTDSQYIHLQATFTGASDHVNYPLVMNIWRGGLVSPGKISKNAESLAIQNRAGFNNVAGLSFVGSTTKNSTRNVFRLQSVSSTGIQYSPDAWLLYMKGNGPFSGEEMNLSGTGDMSFGAYQMSYGKAGVKNMPKNKLFWSLLCDLSVITHLNYGNIRSGKLYTDSFGRYLDIQTSSQWNYSDKIGIAGWGGGISGSFGQYNEYSGWTIGVENISAAYTGSRMKRADIDTAFRFEGVQISSVKDASESDYWSKEQDSITDVFLSHRSIQKWHLLPGLIYSSFWQKLNETNRLMFGINYQYRLYQRPELYLSHAIDIRKFYINSRISWGAWGEIQWYEQIGYRNQLLDISILAGGMHTAWVVTLPAQVSGGFRLLIFPKGR